MFHIGSSWLARSSPDKPELAFDRAVVSYGGTDQQAGIDGSAAGRRAAAWRGLAVTTAAGRLSLHRQAQRQTGRPAGPLGQEPGALFSRDRRGAGEARAAPVRARWRARHPDRRHALLRGAADATASCSEPAPPPVRRSARGAESPL